MTKRIVTATDNFIDMGGCAVGPRNLANTGRDVDAYYRIKVFVPFANSSDGTGVLQLVIVRTPVRTRAITAALTYAASEYPEGDIFGKARIAWMRRSWESRAVTLLKLGAAYERTWRVFDSLRQSAVTGDLETNQRREQQIDEAWERYHLVEQNIQAVASHMIAFEEGVPEMLVVRGRNIIRRFYGLEEIHV